MAEDKSAGAVKVLEKKLQQGKWNAGNALAQEQGAIEQTKNTQMALDQIFNATGHDNVEDLVAAMTTLQEQIDNNFLHASGLDDINQGIAAEVAMLREEGEAAVGATAEAEGHRRKMERHVEEQLARQDEKMKDCDAEVDAAHNIEKQIFPKVQELYDMLDLAPKTDVKVRPPTLFTITHTHAWRWQLSGLRCCRVVCVCVSRWTRGRWMW